MRPVVATGSQADTLQRRCCPSTSFGCPDAGIAERKLRIVESAAAGKQCGKLENKTDFPASNRCARIFVQAADVTPIENVLALIRSLQEPEDAHKSRFAGP